MLPRLNGYEILPAMRQRSISVPVLVLSARAEEKDKVMGLDLGAEDYVTKPFSVPSYSHACVRRFAATVSSSQRRPTSGHYHSAT